MAVRKIPKNYIHVTGRMARGPGTTPAEFESLLEKDFLILLAFDPAVADFEPQPVHVPLPGRSRPYTPDVLVVFKPGPRGGQREPELVEVKPAAVLERKKEELAPKFEAALRFARQQGWKFVVRTEVDIRNKRLENIKFVRGYQKHKPKDDEARRLLEVLSNRGGSATSSSLLAEIEPDQTLRLHWYPVLWHLVSTHRIAFDLDVPMPADVPLWLANGAEP